MQHLTRRHPLLFEDMAVEASRPFAQPDLTRNIEAVPGLEEAVCGELIPDKFHGQKHVRDEDDAPPGHAQGPDIVTQGGHGAQAGGLGLKLRVQEVGGDDAEGVSGGQAGVNLRQGEVFAAQ